MEVSGERVTGGSAVGDRDAHSKWQMNTAGKKVEDFEEFFRAFSAKILSNQGSFKVDGSLLFEFVPKAYMRSEKLISPETSFYFHRMAEGFVYKEEGSGGSDLESNSQSQKKSPALEGYNYQKKLPPLTMETLDRFMPAV